MRARTPTRESRTMIRGQRGEREARTVGMDSREVKAKGTPDRNTGSTSREGRPGKLDGWEEVAAAGKKRREAENRALRLPRQLTSTWRPRSIGIAREHLALTPRPQRPDRL